MKGKSPDPSQLSLLPQRLEDLVNPRHPLYKLSKRIPWDDIEKYFSDLYHQSGRPAKPIRLMVSLLILKQLYNLSDESIVERWVENPYYQFFSAETVFQWEFPCHPRDLVYFRKRIGKKGVEKILKVSIALHGKKAKESEMLVDTMVQEKNITFPTDTKLYKRVIEHCVSIARKESIELRQSYKGTSKKLMLDQRFRNHPRNKKKALSAQRKLKTIAGRLVRELERKLPAASLLKYAKEIEVYQRILNQEKKSKKKSTASMSPKFTA